MGLIVVYSQGCGHSNERSRTIKALNFLPILCKCGTLICLLGVCLRNLLYDLSEDISSENLKSMIFLLRESIPKVQMVSGPCRMGSVWTLPQSVFGKMLERDFRRVHFFCRRQYQTRVSNIDF